MTLSASDSVSIIDTSSNAVIGGFAVGSSPRGVAVSADGRRVYVTNECGNGACADEAIVGSVSVFDAISQTIVATVPVGIGPRGIALNPAGTRAYVTNTAEATVSVIDTTTNSVSATVTLAGAVPEGIAVRPDGLEVYVGAGRSLVVIDATSNAVVASVPTGARQRGIGVNPNGTRIYVAHCGAEPTCGVGAGSLSVIDLSSRSVLATIVVTSSEPGGVVVSADGTRVFLADGNSVVVIDAASNSIVGSVGVGSRPVGVALTSTGLLCVANAAGDTMSVVNPSTGSVVATLRLEPNSVPFALGRFVGPVPSGC